MFVLNQGRRLQRFTVALYVVLEILYLNGREDHRARDKHACQRTDRVEDLCQIQTLCGGFGRPHRKNIRICGGLQKGQTKGQNIEGDNKLSFSN